MARSLATTAGLQANGEFEHAFSKTRFTVRTDSSGVWQTLQRPGESETLRVQYVIGSGAHAFGYLAQVGDHLFQSPVSYYTKRAAWDIAPGYEQTSDPDFSRPVTLECVLCHSDKPRPRADTLNSYQSPPFEGLGIGCDRCHGPTEAHLKRPVPGSIISPAKLPQAARDSVCEQCHLAGEIRIPNAGKSVADFHAGERTEDVYTTYVIPHGPEEKIKVISQAEQLAMSMCARNSHGKLWCGTCHNPHEMPARAAEYFRARCLTCHGATLDPAHAAPGRDCVACHMPARPAKDGGHTSFTDHRITRFAHAPERPPVPGAELRAWREPPEPVQQRNLAMALVTVGLQNSEPQQVIRGYRMLSHMESGLSGDAAALTVLGNVLLTAKEPAEAKKRFERALELRPKFAPYEVNLAAALLAAGDSAGALSHLQRAVALDPLLPQAVQLLSQVYTAEGQRDKAETVMAQYRAAMGIGMKPGQ